MLLTHLLQWDRSIFESVADEPSHFTVSAPDTNGKMLLSNAGRRIVCRNAFGFGFNITCEYEASSAEWDVTGSDTAPIIHENLSLSKVAGSEFVCGVNIDWSGTYVVTTPGSLFIV
jgi:hypothetical protein